MGTLKEDWVLVTVSIDVVWFIRKLWKVRECAMGTESMDKEAWGICDDDVW